MAFLACFIAPAALCAPVSIDFCESAANLPLPYMNEFAPLASPLVSPLADLNGESSMQNLAEFTCELGGNALPDCSCELGLVAALLADSELDFTGAGGVSHQMVYGAFISNRQMLKDFLGVNTYAALMPIFEPVVDLAFAYLTIGDGTFEEVQPGEYVFSGSGGYGIALLHTLPVALDPQLFDIGAYQKLPGYLSPYGDADADGYSNSDEFIASDNPADFVAGALDASFRGSESLTSGEGEGEGEGEEDPALPAATTLTAVLLFSIYALLGILLHPRGRRKKKPR